MLGKVFKAKGNIQTLIDRRSQSNPDWKPIYFGIVTIVDIFVREETDPQFPKPIIKYTFEDLTPSKFRDSMIIDAEDLLCFYGEVPEVVKKLVFTGYSVGNDLFILIDNQLRRIK